jgi:hypothetical protein
MRNNYAVHVDGIGKRISGLTPDTASDLWSFICQGSNAGLATGNASAPISRLLQIRFLPPIVALQLLTALQPYFDVEQLFSDLISRGPSTGYIPHLGRDTGARYFWSFSMKYYYLSAGRPDVYEGQVAGLFHEEEEDLYICRGTSVIALSLELNNLPDDVEEATRPIPYTLLTLSCNQQTDSKRNSWHNGAEAFLWAIHHEVSWVRRSLRHVSTRIASMAIPSDDFLFDKEYRESLLFEDQSYTKSRTYFWALQSLGAINDCVTSLISAWDIYDQSSLLRLFEKTEASLGVALESHSTRDGSPSESTGEYKICLSEIQQQMEKLQDLFKTNNAKQEEIKSLRDGLFNASTVLEARTTVLQGRNIQLLTYISILFLPASFVASIFGMDSVLPSGTSLRDFAIMFSVICGFTYIVILLLLFRDIFYGPHRAQRKKSRISKHGKEGRPQWWTSPVISRMKIKKSVDSEKGV